MFLPSEILPPSDLWKEKDNVLTLLPHHFVFGRKVSLPLQQRAANHPNFALVISSTWSSLSSMSHPSQWWETAYSISPDRSCSETCFHVIQTSVYSCHQTRGNHSISAGGSTALLPWTARSPPSKEKGRGRWRLLMQWWHSVVTLQENTVQA